MSEPQRIDRRSGRRADRAALRAALVFALAGIAWILGSDAVLDAVVSERVEAWLQTVKGSLFILAAATVVFLLVRRYGRQFEEAAGEAESATEALRRSESRYRFLVERVPGVVWLNEVDRDDPDQIRCVYIAPQIEDLLGYTPEAWIDDVDLWEKVIHPDDLPRVLKLNDLADERGSLSMEYRALRTDGTEVWIHDEAVLTPADGDRPAYWQGVMVDITAQRAQDRALHELSESLQAVFRGSPLAILVLERDGRVRHWNPAAERMFGWSAAEVIGRAVPYVPPDRQAEFAEAMGRTATGGAIAGLETVRVRKDGSRVDVSLTTAGLTDLDGNVTGLLGVLEDITERKRVADELDRRQRQQAAIAGLGFVAMEGGDLQKLLDSATALVAETLAVPLSAVVELLPGEEILEVHAGVGWRPGVVGSHQIPRAEPSLAGYCLELGEPVVVDDLRSEWRFTPPADLLEHGVVSAAAAVISGGRHPYGVLEALATDAHVFSRDAVRFLQGVAAIIGLAIERERAEQARRTTEEKYRSLVEESPAIVYLHEVDDFPTHITYIGPQIADLLGHPPEAWTASDTFWESVVHPADRERFRRTDRAAIERGLPLDIEYRMLAADGREVWVQDRATLIRGVDGEPLFYQGVLVDISGRHQAEDERRAALDRQLRLATRLELLHLIDREVLSSTSIGEMASRTLDHLRLLVPYDRGSVALLDQETDQFSYVAIRQSADMDDLVPNLEDHRLDGAARALLATDLLVADVNDLDVPSKYAEAAGELGIRSAVVIALGSDSGQLGALVLTSRTVNAFDEEAFDIAREVGSELAIAIAQMRLRHTLADRAQELERLAEERQQMLHRIVRAQEEERERVALELHDGLGQILTSISLFASDLAHEVGEEAKPRAERVNELIRRAIADSRQLVWSLRPPELERLGLVPALRRLADETSAPELTVDLHEQIGDVRLPPESEAVVYRVVQEAVHNAQKHAHATAISILLQRTNGQITTLVEDNGGGFDPASIPPGRGLGLVGMRERAELVEGALVVESAVAAGTRIRLTVPVGAIPPEADPAGTDGGDG
jgi:PAS domain S-box-containing protein